MKKYLDCNVVVTGAGGSIGSEICRQIARGSPARMILADISELALFNIWGELSKSFPEVTLIPLLGDVSKPGVFSDVGPVDFLFHAAAYKHVNLSRLNPATYFSNNILSTNACLEFCESIDANFVLVSTDKAVSPENIMGMSKRACEVLTLAYSHNVSQRDANKFSIVRFGNVLNSSGSVIPIFKKQISAGGPVTVTHKDATRFFMSISEAAALVVNCPDLDSLSRIFVLDMGKPVSILSLAHNQIEQAGFRPTLDEPKPEEIKIQIIGLREGEKLSEVLSYSDQFREVAPKINSPEELVDFTAAHYELCLSWAHDSALVPDVNFDWYRFET